MPFNINQILLIFFKNWDTSNERHIQQPIVLAFKKCKLVMLLFDLSYAIFQVSILLIEFQLNSFIYLFIYLFYVVSQ